jgi:hypothetical protein
MICRILHGYTTNENADRYERLLNEEIFIGIKNREISGYKGIQLLSRQIDNETEFITIMWFDSIDSVIEFAGKNYENAVVPDKAQMILSRFDKQSQHYEVKTQDLKYIHIKCKFNDYGAYSCNFRFHKQNCSCCKTKGTILQLA